MLLRLLPALVSLFVAPPACAHGDRSGRAESTSEEAGTTAYDTEAVAPSAVARPRETAPPAVRRRMGAAMQPGRAEEPRKVRSGEAVAPGGEPAGRAPVLIYTAQLTMAIFEVEPALKSAETLARELGGFMSRQTNNSIIIRVPVARFHEAIGRLEKLGDITNRDISAEDVTQEFFDLEVRLKSARAVRERLEQLLHRANKVDESIAIERELERVVGEIERLEGRLKYLHDRALFSTISVTFAARPKEMVAKDTFKLPFPWLDHLGLGRLLKLR
jgi:hypothetical protein